MVQTANTIRLTCSHPEACSIAVSRLLYPASMEPWRANSVILASDERFQTVIPVISLIHFPFDGALLIVRGSHLTPAILEEIGRLQPKGEGGVPKVILAGAFDNPSIRRLHQMGLSTLTFRHADPMVQAVHIAEWRKRMLPEMMPEMITTNTFVVSVESPEEFLPALGFSAHLGTPILYVNHNSIPALTRDFFLRDRNITIIGSERTVSEHVEQELRKLVSGTVERIGGKNPAEIAVRFARTKSSQTGIGWGRDKPGVGDAFSFFPADWRYAMLSAPLSHLGKHTPLLPLSANSIPPEYMNYLDYLRPRGMHPEPPFMHAFIVGNEQLVPFELQLTIEKHISFQETMEPAMPKDMEDTGQHSM